MGIARLFTQPVTVATWQASDSFGPSFAEPVDRMVFINSGRQRTASSGYVELTSKTTLYDSIDAVDLYSPGTRVTVDGDTSTVVTRYRRDSAGPVSAHHVEVILT